MGVRTRAAALVVLLSAGLACRGTEAAETAMTPFERVVSDSLHGDSVAFEALPPSLSEYLDVRPILADSSIARCGFLPSTHEHEQRRRVRMRFADSATTDSTFVVLYAVADDSTGKLGRVEYIRRVPRQGQRGLIWDAENDRTTSTWWGETRWGLSRRVERGDIPRGSPLPRALRALGRQLLLMPCAEPSDSTAPNAP